MEYGQIGERALDTVNHYNQSNIKNIYTKQLIIGVTNRVFI